MRQRSPTELLAFCAPRSRVVLCCTLESLSSYTWIAVTRRHSAIIRRRDSRDRGREEIVVRFSWLGNSPRRAVESAASPPRCISQADSALGDCGVMDLDIIDRRPSIVPLIMILIVNKRCPVSAPYKQRQVRRNSVIIKACLNYDKRAAFISIKAERAGTKSARPILIPSSSTRSRAISTASRAGKTRAGKFIFRKTGQNIWTRYRFEMADSARVEKRGASTSVTQSRRSARARAVFLTCLRFFLFSLFLLLFFSSRSLH